MLVGTIIVVTHNSSQHIGSCLQSIAREPNWNIILVDNASTDDSIKTARCVVPHIQVVANRENLGFAAALNQAAALADGELLLVLNPDTLAAPGALAKIAEVFADERVGAVGGMLATLVGLPQIGFTVRQFPTLSSAVAELLLLNRVWPRNPLNRRYRCLDLNYAKPQEVEQPAGACLAIRRSAWGDLGGFDEDFYPVWFEDVDFCRRLRIAGWRILYCPHAVFVHAGGHSVSQLSFSDRQDFWYRNLLRYFSKHHSRIDLSCLRIALVAGLLLRTILCFFNYDSGVSIRLAVVGYLRTIWRYGVLRHDLQSGSKSPAIKSMA